MTHINKTDTITYEEKFQIIKELFRKNPFEKYSEKYAVQLFRKNTRAAKDEVHKIFSELVSEEFILRTGDFLYRRSLKSMQHHVGKVVTISHFGTVFIKSDDFDTDIDVGDIEESKVFPGDMVSFVIRYKNNYGKIYGIIDEVVERSKTNFIGIVISQTEGQNKLTLNTHSMIKEAFSPRNKALPCKIGDKVVARAFGWEEGKLPQVKITKVLGQSEENDTEMHAIMEEYGLPYEFSKEVINEAKRIPAKILKSEINSRLDMRAATTFTIDPEDAKDFDDALSCMPFEDGVWEVGVHIADVTHYVKQGSLLDKEALRRGTSVYLVDRTIPMLPERLSNDLCSLRPDEDKLCFSVIFKIKEDGTVLKRDFAKTVIRSNRRFTYEQVQKIIEGEDGDFATEILVLNKIAQNLRKIRFESGSITFERKEAKFHLDEKGAPTDIFFSVQKEANQLIEEFMLLANRSVSELCSKKNGKPRTMIYRIHDKPDSQKLQSLQKIALNFGHNFKIGKKYDQYHELNTLIHDSIGHAEENIITTLALRAMSKACYSTVNIGHYGLGFKFYSHFTSPIRRYPDIIAHRILEGYLCGDRAPKQDTVETMCEQCSDMELLAATAERESVKYKMVEYMIPRKDEIFEGHITSFIAGGFYVELEDSLIEGFVNEIENGYIDINDRFSADIIKNKGIKTCNIGDMVTLKIKSCNLGKRIIYFKALKVSRLSTNTKKPVKKGKA